MGVSPWMNAKVGPSVARRAKEGASADSAEEMKDTTGVSPWRLHKKSGKWYLEWVEEIPGVNTQGEILEEVKANLKEALALVLETKLLKIVFRKIPLGRSV